MPANQSSLKRGLTPIQGLSVVVILAVAAGLAWVGRDLWARARTQQHLRAAIPRLCEELSQQRGVLVSSIEAYKVELGFYPPDHLLGRTPLRVDAVTNQLMYELLGTLHDSAKDTFTPPHSPVIRRALIKQLFGAEGFKNSAEKPELVRHFLDGTKLAASTAIHEKPEEVGLASYWPNWEGIEPDLYAQISPGTWCYNSSAPAHHPGSYDLWIEVKTPLTNIVIGNW
jgi:hypothetical protein